MKTRFHILLAALIGTSGPMIGGPVPAAADAVMNANPTADDFIEALTPKPKTRGIRPRAETEAYTDVPTITFEFDSAELTPGARQVLDQLAIALQSEQLDDSRFLLEGHTDAVGGERYNQALSEQRALAVREYLTTKQVGAVRLEAVGKGESDLLDGTDGPSALNRRVRVVNLSQN